MVGNFQCDAFVAGLAAVVRARAMVRAGCACSAGDDIPDRDKL
jgi:hypothetical protein